MRRACKYDLGAKHDTGRGETLDFAHHGSGALESSGAAPWGGQLQEGPEAVPVAQRPSAGYTC